MTKKITLDYKKIAILIENNKRLNEWFENSKKPFPIFIK